MLKRVLYGLSFILLLSTAAGCAAPQKEIVLYWPPLPEEPRIAYVKSYVGGNEYYQKTFADTLFGVPAGKLLGQPYAVAAANDKMCVTLSSSSEVVCFDNKARKTVVLGSSSKIRLGLALGVAVGPDGTVYVSDADSKVIDVFDKDGNVKAILGKNSGMMNPVGLALNAELGRLYVVDSKANCVHVFSTTGEKLFSFGKNGKNDGEFYFPAHIALDRRNGNIYVADTQNFRVQKFDKDGKFLSKFGEIGDQPGTFSRPKGIGVDSEGHVYVADAAFNNIQIFDEHGQILLYFGSLGTGLGNLQLPAGMAVDEKDRIYVADTVNNRVQVYQYLSDKWKKEHPEEYKKYSFPELGAP